MLVALPELLTMFINLIGADTIETPVFTIPYFAGTVRSNDILLTNFSFKQLFINLWYTLKASLIQLPDYFHNSIPAFGTMYHISIPFVFIGVYKAFVTFIREDEIQKKNGILILLAWLLMGIWVGLNTKEVNINRINIIHYPLIILAGIGVGSIKNKFKRLYQVTLLIYVILFASFSATYFSSFAMESKKEYHADLIDAYKFADSLPVDYICVSTNERAEITEILLQYALEIDAQYYQENTNLQAGKEYLPFGERYTFYQLGADALNWEQENTAYIVTEDEWTQLDEQNYEIYDYGSYRIYVYE